MKKSNETKTSSYASGGYVEPRYSPERTINYTGEQVFTHKHIELIKEKDGLKMKTRDIEYTLPLWINLPTKYEFKKYAILDNKNNNQVKIVESNSQPEEILRNYPLGYSAVVVD